MLEKIEAGGEGGDRGQNGWMASLTQQIWVGTNCGRQWRTGKPGVLQSMGSRTAGHNLTTDKQQVCRQMGTQQSELKFLCPTVSAGPANVSLQTFAFPSSCELLSSPWSPIPLPSTPSSVFTWRWDLWLFRQLTQFSWVSPMYMVFKFLLDFLLICLMSTQFLA